MSVSNTVKALCGELSFDRPSDGTLLVRLSGVWKMKEGLPSASTIQEKVNAEQGIRSIAFNTKEVEAWDSGFLTFLTKVIDQSAEHHIEVDRTGLPSGVQRLLALAEAVPERKGARSGTTQGPFLERIGKKAIAYGESAVEMFHFLGEVTVTFVKLLKMKARYRRSDLFRLIQECGVDALPIVSLISFLVGVILAFVGAIQLQQFGAQIYLADLVGIAMVREMGAMMAGIIMAGRTGAAFAAQIGTMKVTQEIDAFTTVGFSPLEFLVLPRMIALILMMPLLYLYASLIGILGGATMGVGVFDLSWTTYFRQTCASIGLPALFGGLLKSSVYGVLIAISGCLRGLQCGNSSSAVGDAATSAVVTSITLIVTASGVFAVVFYVLGI